MGEVVGKFVVLPLIFYGVQILFYLLLLASQLFSGPKLSFSILLTALGLIFALFITPALSAVYSFVMYQHVRRPVNGDKAGRKTKLLIWGGFGLGVVLIVGSILLAFALAWINPLGLSQDGCLSIEGQCDAPTTMQEMTIMKSDLEAYYNINGLYPQSALTAFTAPKATSDEVEWQGVANGKIVYQSLDGGKNYKLCLTGFIASCVMTHHVFKVSPSRPASQSATIQP